MPLVVEKLRKSFGGLCAVADVSFSVGDRTIVGLIGPNGAGKSTVFNLVTGVYRPDRGSVALDGLDLTSLPPAKIARAGIARTFQNIRLFAQLTVLENLLVACEPKRTAGLTTALLRSAAHYEEEAALHERADEALRVFELQDVADEPPGSLSYGNQRRLEIARAIMLRPRVLLLDEPAAGLSSSEATALQKQLRWIRDTFEVAIVLVEHNMQVVKGVCEEVHVLDRGETIAHGPPDVVYKDAKVVAAYLGAEAKDSPKEAEEPMEESVALLLVRPAQPEALPRLADRSISEPTEVSEVAKILTVEVRPLPASRLSDEAVASLSRDLMQNLEKGLSQNMPVAAPIVARLDVETSGEQTKEYVAAGDATKEYPTKDDDATRIYVPAAKEPDGARALLDTSELEITERNPAADARHWANQASQVALPTSSGARSERLSNVDSDWSDHFVAAQAVEPSAPDVASLDKGWSSGRLPAGKTDPPKKG